MESATTRQKLPGHAPTPPKPPSGHPEATRKPYGSQPVATLKPPGGYPEAPAQWSRREKRGNCPCIHKSSEAGAEDLGGGPDAGADGQPVYAVNLWIGDSPDFLLAAIGAHRVHPQDEAQQVHRIHFHVMMFATRSEGNELMCIDNASGRTTSCSSACSQAGLISWT